MQTNLGGSRLGSGNKMTVNLQGYGSTTYNLSHSFKTSMTVGTLVPFLKQIMLNGDVANIDLSSVIRTHPTISALFGSFKLQLDVFKCPIRYYNAMLHNNQKGIGMNMDKVKFPQFSLQTNQLDLSFDNSENPNLQQIDPSSLIAYLGIRGNGYNNAGDREVIRKYNAIPLLAYWDIYANYYANQQEKIGYVIAPNNLHAAVIYKIETQSGTQSYITRDTKLYTTPQGAVGTKVNIPIGERFLITGTNITIDSYRYNLAYLDKTTNNYIYFNNQTAAQLKDKGINVNVNKNNTKIELTSDGLSYLWSDDVNTAIIPTGTRIPATGIRLRTFDLKNIDTMRDWILKNNNNTPFNINEKMIENLPMEPYATNIEAIYDSSTFYANNNKYPLNGLGIKTYQSDRFNNWIDTKYIDGAQGVTALSKIDVSNGELTMDALNLQQKVYNLLNRIAVSGGTYKDWQEAVYDRVGKGEIEIPEWVGGMSSEIVFDEVVSTASTDSEALGTIGGRGRQEGANRNHITVHANEPLYLIGIVSLTPRLDYSQGNDWDTRLENINQLHKPQFDGIGFQELITDEFAAFDTSTDNNNVNYKSAGKQLAFTEYTTEINKALGNFAAGKSEQFMTLSRNYEQETYGGLKDLTTYIDPIKFSYAFATTDLEAQHFWLQIGINMSMSRVMATKQIPTL